MGKNERGDECDSCAQSRAQSQKWDAKGRRRSKRRWGKLKRVWRGQGRAREGEGGRGTSLPNSNLWEPRKSSMGDLGRRWRYARVHPSECKALLTSHLNVEHQSLDAAPFALVPHGRPRGKICPSLGREKGKRCCPAATDLKKKKRKKKGHLTENWKPFARHR